MYLWFIPSIIFIYAKCNPDALSNLEQISVRLYLFMHSQALSGIFWVVPCGTTGYPATPKLNPGSLWFVPCIVKSGPDILPSLFINHNYKDGEILPDMRHYRISGHSLALSKIFRVDLCILKSGPIIYFLLYLFNTTKLLGVPYNSVGYAALPDIRPYPSFISKLWVVLCIFKSGPDILPSLFIQYYQAVSVTL